MLTEGFSKRQIARLSGLDYFPSGEQPIRELRSALEAANSEAVAESVVTAWLATNTGAPKPAELRGLIYERNNATAAARKRCEICNGDGFITRWYLRTTDTRTGRTRGEVLPDVHNQEQADRFCELLPDHQTVLSGAALCSCHAPLGEGYR